MEINEQLGKVIVGHMLRSKREEDGAIQRDHAIALEMANINYLSMIEKGTHTIPIKRLGDFIKVYALSREEGLAVIRLTSHDVWTATKAGIMLAKGGEKTVSNIEKATEKIIRKYAAELNLTIG